MSDHSPPAPTPPPPPPTTTTNAPSAMQPHNFKQVLRAELGALNIARRSDESAPAMTLSDDPAASSNDADAAQLLGLAFSGGGIRSATFNLGVLQALAQLGWLTRVDYLSTVSGGGYIGGWLSAWIKRAGRTRVNDALAATAQGSSTLAQRAPLDHLRRFSNYLTPKLGAMSADFWTGVATYIRNLLLNQTILIPLLVLTLLVPWALSMLANFLTHYFLATTDHSLAGSLPGSLQLVVLAFVLLCMPAVVAGVNFADAALTQGRAHFWERETVVARLLGLMLPAAFCLALWLQQASAPVALRLFVQPITQVPLIKQMLTALLMGAGAYCALIALCGLSLQLRWLRSRVRVQQPSPKLLIALLGWSLVAGAAGGVMLFGLQNLLQSSFFVGEGWLLPGLGTVLVLIALANTVVIHIGLMGRKFSESIREWLGRAAAWLFIFGAAWSGLFAITFVSPLVLFAFFGWASGAGGVAWLATTIAGVLLGRGDKTGSSAKPTATPTTGLRDVLAQGAPYIFMIGLLGLLASALYLFVVSGIGSDDPMAMIDACRDSFIACFHAESATVPRVDGVAIAWVAAISLSIAVLMGWRIDVNVFSFHGYYRNRISRAYLGASNAQRRPQPFTGFDEDDNVKLHELAMQRPLHIINTALNLTRANNLAWQERKAASFAMTPLHCGYDLECQGNSATYLPTHLHRDTGLHMATAIATSGAAASPNMGYHSSLPVAFLMTLFNVRLGWWMPNPRYPGAWRSPEPQFSVWYILKELFGSADESSSYVYLSDGGHFDNMGLYELVRRRCRYIIVADAEADGDFTFEGIGSAIRKCRIDFDVAIELDIEAVKPKRRRRDSGASAVVGTIQYPGAKTLGYLLYLKSSLLDLDALPADVRNYAYQNTTFPHEPTSDQWFGEAQFESYRRLGYEITKRALCSATGTTANATTPMDVQTCFEQLMHASNAARGLSRQNSASSD